MSTPSSTPAPPEPSRETPAPASRWVAKLGVCSAVALTIALVVLLGWRWFHVRFPTSVFIAYGDPAAAELDLRLLTADGVEVSHGRLTPEGSYRFAVLVDEGVYVLKSRLGDQSLPDQRVFVPANRGVTMRVVVPPGLRPTTAPTAPPSTTRPGAGRTTLPDDPADPPPP